MSELYLVRHAQASFGAENYDQLSSIGHQQSLWLAEYFFERSIIFDVIARGGMQRHKQTLDEVCRKMLLDINSQKILSGLDEYDFKYMIDLYGKQYPDNELYQTIMSPSAGKEDYFRLLRHVLLAWSQEEIKGVKESWHSFQERVAKEMNLIQQSAKPGERILIVSSGGAISMFIGLVLGLSSDKIIELNLQTKNTSISQFIYNQDKISLSGFNAIPHLDYPDRVQYITYG